MLELTVHYLPWLLSTISVVQMVMVGNLSKRSWLLGLGNQLLWTIWILGSGTWGFLPLNIALWIVYTRNHVKWNRT